MDALHPPRSRLRANRIFVHGAAALALLLPCAARSAPDAPKQADTTPPVIQFVNHPPDWVNTPNVTFSWTEPTDDASGVAAARFWLGTGNPSNDLADVDALVETNYNFTGGTHAQRVYPQLYAVDGAGNSTQVTDPALSVRFDFVGPTVNSFSTPPFADETVPAAFSISDAHSGVTVGTRRILEVGTAPGLADVATIEKTSTSFFEYEPEDYLDANEVHGAQLYHRLRVFDRAGNETATTDPDPVVIDIVDPMVPILTAAIEETTFTFSWGTASDELSGLSSLFLRVGTSPGTQDVFVGSVPHPGSMQFTAANGQNRFATLTAKDNAGNIAVSPVAGGTVDLDPPTVAFDIVGRDQTIADEVTIVAKFNENLSDPLEAEDISLVGMPATFTVTSVTESEFDVTLIPNDPDADGTLGFQIAAQGVADIPGNVFPGALSPTIVFDHNALVIGSETIDCGGEIEVPIELMNAEDVDALGFNLVTGSVCLEYLGATIGAAVSAGWVFEVQQTGPGTLLVGGFRTTAPNPLSGDVELATLRFRTKRNTPECTQKIVPTNLVDDIAGYTIVDGFGHCTDGPGQLAGDVNDDGEITPGDAREAFLCYIQNACNEGSVEARAEIAPDNGDGCATVQDGDDNIDPDDAQRIFEMFLGEEEACD